MNDPSSPVDKTLSYRTDPPAEAWEFDESLPRAGLVEHAYGAELKAARSALVLFHGYGAQGDDLVGLSRVLKLDANMALLFPEAPVALPLGGRAWFRRDRTNLEMGVRRAEAYLSSLVQTNPQIELIVGGFSQGAMLTANLLERGRLPIRAALLLSGADEFLVPPAGGAYAVPLFISHGELDNVLPLAGGEALRDRFVAAGYPVRFVQFSGSHQIPRTVVDGMNAFLAASWTR